MLAALLPHILPMLGDMCRDPEDDCCNNGELLLWGGQEVSQHRDTILVSLSQMKKLVPPVCVCVWDGRQESFEAKYLVPGDLVSLAIGDRIPADVRLVTCSDFAVDESSLTGEPEPILKTVAAIVTSKESLATQEMVNQAFMGTMVVAGRATGLVTATADKTQFGQVFQVRGCPCLLTDIQFSFEQF